MQRRCCGRRRYYVVTVYDNPGLRSLDFRYWTVKHPGSPVVVWPEIGVGWNVDGRCSTELLASYIGSADFGTRISTLNWQNDLLLTRGQYAFDLALHTLLVRPQQPAEGHAFEFGPVLQTDVVRTQLNLNFFLERGFGAAGSAPTQLKYQWQLRHRWKPWLHVGAQGFGEPGAWNDRSPRDDQSHRAGPALFGALPTGERSQLTWQAAYLVGSTYGQHGNMFSMQVKLEF